MPPGPAVRLRPVGWSDLPGWAGDDHAAALAALRRTAAHVVANGAHRTGALGIPGEVFAAAFAALGEQGAADPRRFLEDWFAPHAVEGDDLGGPDGGGFVTGFYEPDLEVAPVRTAAFAHPIHAPPVQLAKNDGTLRADYAWGWRSGDALVEAPDRGTIERDAAAGGPLTADWPVIAWARDRVDLFFVHVQGAARLHFPDGTVRRITYAAKSGHPFTGIGRELVAKGELPEGGVTMGTIRDWLAAHPARVDALLRRNRSYIFFKEAAVDDAALGPVAAAKVPLQPGRSLAVDRLLHTFGTPIHVHAPGLELDGATYSRLMVAQETGTAIVGAARGDIFTGSGGAAGDLAGAIAHAARFTVLVPRPAPGAAPAPLRTA